MEATVLVIAIAIVLIGAFAVIVARRRTEARTEAARHRATETRDLAEVASADADLQAAGAEERAARAERERMAAEQERLDAERRRREAADLQAEADEIDPDVDVRTDAETAEPVDDEVDLREQDTRPTT